MKVFIVLSCLVAMSFALSMSHTDFEWDAWKAKYQKVYYDTKDESARYQIWLKNLDFVDRHNKKWRAGLTSFNVTMNKFADVEAHEFKKLFLGTLRRAPFNTVGCKNTSIYVTDRNYGPVSKAVDWRTKGYVTDVKDQGQCGSCWAFSTTGSLEGQHFKATGELVRLSEQNLMDCSKPEGDFSCEGGLMDYAFDYIIDNHGIDTEESYPYKATDENRCFFEKKNVGATMTSCYDVTPSTDEKALLKAAAHIGPISVAIDASQQSFQLYQSGVYDEPMCSSSELDHGVLVVGYDSKDGKDFWIVKNSWGPGWGMKGYINMSRNKNNQCGIASSASYPEV